MSDPKKNDRRVGWLVCGFLMIFLLLSVAHRIFAVIPAGHKGVLWKLSGGTALTDEFPEGLHLIWPWNDMALYHTRLQSETLQFDVQTLGGLPVTIKVAIQYRPKPGKLALLHREVGRDYLQSYIAPELRSVIAARVAETDHESLYSQRSSLSQAILEDIDSGKALRTQLSDGGQEALVEVPEVFINEVILPPDVEKIVKDKFQKIERLEAAKYDLEIADLNNQLLEKEGQGVARFQQILGSGVKHYLTWKSIEATQKAAESDNSKIVIVGSGQEAPVLINGD